MDVERTEHLAAEFVRLAREDSPATAFVMAELMSGMAVNVARIADVLELKGISRA